MDELRWILLGIAVVMVAAIYFFSRSRKKDQPVSPLDAANEVPSFKARESFENEWVDGVGPVRVVGSSDEEVIDHFREEQDDSELSSKNYSQPEDRFNIEPIVNDSPAEIYPVDPREDEYEDDEAAADEFEQQSPGQFAEAAEKTPGHHSGITHTEESESEATSPEANEKEAAVDDVIAVYVLGTEEEPLIKGEKILSASYALHLEHGDMKIFHRHSETDQAKILFSMANIMQPGWFDIEHMHQLETRGVSFFMQVNLVDQPSRVLDDMLICAHGMATMLGASLCNPSKQLLDEAYTSHLREKVKKLAELKAHTV